MSHKLSVFFLTKLKKTELEKFVFYIVAFDSIEIQTCLDPQNDHQNLSFVKDVHVVGKKMTRNAGKIAKLKGCAFHFETEFSSTSIHGFAFSKNIWPLIFMSAAS